MTTIHVYDADELEIIYLDWFNNFLTVPVFAEHYAITESFAERIINLGREIHESWTI